MKYKLDMHVPVEQYGYIGVTEFEGTPVEAYELYREIKEAMKPVEGLTAKDFNECIDKYMATGTLNGGTELYYQMNDKQKFFFQELKKHNKRANYETKD